MKASAVVHGPKVTRRSTSLRAGLHRALKDSHARAGGQDVTGLLLDTNVILELRRPRPNVRVREFIARQKLEDLFVSSVTMAEIRFGIESVSDLGCRAELSDWLEHRVRPMFVQRVLEVS